MIKMVVNGRNYAVEEHLWTKFSFQALTPTLMPLLAGASLLGFLRVVSLPLVLL